MSTLFNFFGTAPPISHRGPSPRHVSLSLDLRPIMDSTPPLQPSTTKEVMSRPSGSHSLAACSGHGKMETARAILLAQSTARCGAPWLSSARQWDVVLRGSGTVTYWRCSTNAGRQDASTRATVFVAFKAAILYVCNCSNSMELSIFFVT